MQQQVIGSIAVLVKHGTIESTGNHQVTPLLSQFNGVTFSDGETIRQFVQVESSIASWMSPGIEGRFVFVQGPGQILMLAAVETDKGLRVTNPRFATHLSAEAAGHAIWYGLAAIICIAVFGLIGPLAIITAPAFVTFLVLAFKGVRRFRPYSRFGVVVRNLDRTRQVPTANRGTIATAV